MVINITPQTRCRIVFDEGEGTESTEFELPILRGKMGPAVLDVRGLYGKTGLFTHDPGFTSTSRYSLLWILWILYSTPSCEKLDTVNPPLSCSSAITFIDGEVNNVFKTAIQPM